MTWNRRDPERRAEQQAAANRARYRAQELLIQENLDEFNRIYREQAALVGVTAKPVRRHQVKVPRRQVRPKVKSEPETIEELRYQLRLARQRLRWHQKREAESGG
jgi:hypothetical protein